MLARSTIRAVKKQLALDGINTGVRALSEFFSWWQLRQVFTQAAADTKNFSEMARKSLPDLPREKLDLLADLHFNLASCPGGDPRLFLAFKSAKHKEVMDRMKFDQAGRKLKLDDLFNIENANVRCGRSAGATMQMGDMT